MWFVREHIYAIGGTNTISTEFVLVKIRQSARGHEEPPTITTEISMAGVSFATHHNQAEENQARNRPFAINADEDNPDNDITTRGPSADPGCLYMLGDVDSTLKNRYMFLFNLI